MKKCFKIFIMGLTATILCGCEKILFKDDPVNSPGNNFEMFWGDFNKFYPFFGIKKINWDSVYALYRPAISSGTSGAELFDVFSEMIKPLNDYHVKLITDLGIVQSLELPDPGNYFSWYRIYPQKYLDSFQPNQQNMNHWSITGTNLGYISINTFGTRGSNPFVFADKSFLIIDEILEEFKNKDGIIIDLRWNGGGYPANMETVAGRFTTIRRLYLRECSKNGPGQNDFSVYKDYFILPGGRFQFQKPVVVLTSRYTGSAAEWFVLVIKTLPGALVVGDTTAGGFSPQITRELPNGWSFCMSTKIVMSYDLKLYEGVGIPPDFPIHNTKQNFENKRDAMLEKAIELLMLE